MQIINHESYKSLCDIIYDGPKRIIPHQNCVVYVPMDNIYEFFLGIRDSNNKYVVVSGSSDYGVCEQSRNPVSEDMIKWIQFQVQPQGYDPLYIGPRCVSEYCKITDKYSIKMHFYTKATFNEIPSQVVHWFAVNADLQHERVTQIPFGIPSWTDELIQSSDKPRINNLYVNFQLNNLVRVHLWNVLQNQPWCAMSKEVSHRNYVDDLLTYRFILSPPGNGLDCYRNLEAIYLGAIPVMEAGLWAMAYKELPVLFVRDVERLNYDTYLKFQDFDFSDYKLEGSRADLGYWRNRIEEAKGLL